MTVDWRDVHVSTLFEDLSLYQLGVLYAKFRRAERKCDDSLMREELRILWLEVYVERNYQKQQAWAGWVALDQETRKYIVEEQRDPPWL